MLLICTDMMLWIEPRGTFRLHNILFWPQGVLLCSPESGVFIFKFLSMSVNYAEAIDPMGSSIVESIARTK